MVNMEGSEFKIEPGQLKVIQSKLIDNDMNRIAEPLHPAKVERMELEARVKDEVMKAKITGGEREMFRPEEAVQ
jgi:hypothetical protein